MTSPARISVLASGGGSNLQALIDHFAGRAASAGVIAFVASERAEAGALDRARAAGIATGVLNAPNDSDAILSLLHTAKTDVLVLAGYLKLVPAPVVRAFRGRILNVHPALLPSFGGPGMYGMRIHHAVLDHGAALTGVTVHFVDEHFDRGPIIAQWPVPVLPGDDATVLGRVCCAPSIACCRCACRPWPPAPSCWATTAACTAISTFRCRCTHRSGGSR